ncbi:hypothetical protein HNV11_11595 [Spirosoma taeanense]|uniref:Uncharacterized protein n=1 Tax=Spirosoma taeanense TaxID=2735870 RepID=A0A6M5Y9U2_9BACT|nr:hypothetical protein [Spirosoma taeanense]QJW89973.1 hypothetical protein HNV11_11595 [Spirosoma taeanense]
MEANTLVVVTGYGSISPKPWKRAYLNISEEKAHQRFLAQHPGVRDVSVKSLLFKDELVIRANGDIALV